MLTDYFQTIKWTHIGLALTSGSLFFIRGLGVLTDRLNAAQPMLRKLSYAIDTGLLIAALCLLWILGMNPFVTPWLSVKLGLLLAYIVAGSLALKRARTTAARRAFFVLALTCFGMMYWVARTHRPLPWLVT